MWVCSCMCAHLCPIHNYNVCVYTCTCVCVWMHVWVCVCVCACIKSSQVKSLFIYLFIYWRLIAQSTAQGRLRAFHYIKSQKLNTMQNRKFYKRKTCKHNLKVNPFSTAVIKQNSMPDFFLYIKKNRQEQSQIKNTINAWRQIPVPYGQYIDYKDIMLMYLLLHLQEHKALTFFPSIPSQSLVPYCFKPDKLLNTLWIVSAARTEADGVFF